jgi:hypothetical protein
LQGAIKVVAYTFGNRCLVFRKQRLHRAANKKICSSTLSVALKDGCSLGFKALVCEFLVKQQMTSKGHRIQHKYVGYVPCIAAWPTAFHNSNRSLAPCKQRTITKTLVLSSVNISEIFQCVCFKLQQLSTPATYWYAQL